MCIISSGEKQGAWCVFEITHICTGRSSIKPDENVIVNVTIICNNNGYNK